MDYNTTLEYNGIYYFVLLFLYYKEYKDFYKRKIIKFAQKMERDYKSKWTVYY